jgi:hypothetical protein
MRWQNSQAVKPSLDFLQTAFAAAPDIRNCLHQSRREVGRVLDDPYTVDLHDEGRVVSRELITAVFN